MVDTKLPVPRPPDEATEPGSRQLSARDVSRVIKLASTMHVSAVARERLERPYTETDLVAMAEDLDIPEVFLRQAMAEVLGINPAVDFEGQVGDVRKRVVGAIVARAPQGTTIERRDDGSVVVHFAPVNSASGNRPAADVELCFQQVGEGTVSVTWNVDTARFKLQRKAGFWLWNALITLPVALLMFAEPNFGMLALTLGCFASWIPIQYLAKHQEQKFLEDVANGLKTIRAVEDLDRDTPELPPGKSR